MGFLSGKKALITGVISDRSIAYGIAEAMHREGAQLAFTYQGEAVKERVAELVKKFDAKILLPCDVSSDDEINNLFHELDKQWDCLDILVHSIAFAPRDQLSGDYLESVTRDGFRIAHEISSYSFTALAKAGHEMLAKSKAGALLTVSYLGSERVIPNYNVMGVAKASLEANMRYMAASLGPQGIRVNAVSPGPIKTLAASGVKNFRKLLSNMEKMCLTHENVTAEQVGNVSAFLCSDLAAGVTGEIIHIDGGFHCASGIVDDT